MHSMNVFRREHEENVLFGVGACCDGFVPWIAYAFCSSFLLKPL